MSLAAIGYSAYNGDWIWTAVFFVLCLASFLTLKKAMSEERPSEEERPEEEKDGDMVL